MVMDIEMLQVTESEKRWSFIKYRKEPPGKLDDVLVKCKTNYNGKPIQKKSQSRIFKQSDSWFTDIDHKRIAKIPMPRGCTCNDCNTKRTKGLKHGKQKERC